MAAYSVIGLHRLVPRKDEPCQRNGRNSSGFGAADSMTRHTNGNLMDRLNAPMKIRQERLGHAPGSNITLALTLTPLGKMTGWSPNDLGEMLWSNTATLA